MLRTITLHGGLSNKFGSLPIKLDADDVPMLFSGLNCAYPSFLNELRQYSQIAIVAKKDDELKVLSDTDLYWPLQDHPELHLYVPVEGSVVTEGAVAGWIVAAFGTAAATATVVTIATIIINLAISVAIGAIARSFAPKPETGADGASVEERRSGLFDQAVNLEGQGHAVPVLYGRFKVGSIVISAEVTTEKNAIAIGDYTSLISPKIVTGNVLSNDVDGGTITITSFVIGGVTYAAGDIYSITGFSLILHANGDFSINALPGFEGDVVVNYYGSSPTTPSLGTTWKIQVQTPQVAYGSSEGSP